MTTTTEGLADDMAREARAVFGTGYVDSYYEDTASGFTRCAEGYIERARREARHDTLRELRARFESTLTDPEEVIRELIEKEG